MAHLILQDEALIGNKQLSVIRRDFELAQRLQAGLDLSERNETDFAIIKRIQNESNEKDKVEIVMSKKNIEFKKRRKKKNVDMECVQKKPPKKILNFIKNISFFRKAPLTQGNTPLKPLCHACGKEATHYLVVLDKIFHPCCFKCNGCHKVIDPGESFAMKDEGPLCQKCHSNLYGLKCSVCHECIPYGENGVISYVKHPFFTCEKMCPCHTLRKKCISCNRFEPVDHSFIDLDHCDRSVCHSCFRTAVTDSIEAKHLWNQVISFLEHELGLSVWPTMRDIPILTVGSDTLNAENTHHHRDDQLIRGLCLSEHQCGKRIQKNLKSNHVDLTLCKRDSHVTAILCLSGLPRDLTASILAHESIHAWFKLHPNFSVANPIPLKVEEGCCQLVAHLLLSDGLGPASKEGEPSDEKLRQYFKFSIEADDNEIYGDGFREAASAYAAVGISVLLDHVVSYRSFPKI